MPTKYFPAHIICSSVFGAGCSSEMLPDRHRSALRAATTALTLCLYKTGEIVSGIDNLQHQVLRGAGVHKSFWNHKKHCGGHIIKTIDMRGCNKPRASNSYLQRLYSAMEPEGHQGMALHVFQIARASKTVLRFLISLLTRFAFFVSGGARREVS